MVFVLGTERFGDLIAPLAAASLRPGHGSVALPEGPAR